MEWLSWQPRRDWRADAMGLLSFVEEALNQRHRESCEDYGVQPQAEDPNMLPSFRRAMALTLFSRFEASMIELLEGRDQEGRVTRDMEGGTLAQFERYRRHVLGVRERVDQGSLQPAYIVRNALAHRAGFLDDDRTTRAVEQLQAEGVPGLLVLSMLGESKHLGFRTEFLQWLSSRLYRYREESALTICSALGHRWISVVDDSGPRLVDVDVCGDCWIPRPE